MGIGREIEVPGEVGLGDTRGSHNAKDGNHRRLGVDARKVGGIIQVSGLRFDYARDGAFGNRLLDVKIGDKELRNDSEYQVATNQLNASGGHNNSTLAAIRERAELQSQFELIQRGLLRRGRVEVSPTSRMMAW